MTFTVFYAGQSDRPTETNRSFIQQALDSALADICADNFVEDTPICFSAGIGTHPDTLAIIARLKASKSSFVTVKLSGARADQATNRICAQVQEERTCQLQRSITQWR